MNPRPSKDQTDIDTAKTAQEAQVGEVRLAGLNRLAVCHSDPVILLNSGETLLVAAVHP